VCESGETLDGPTLLSGQQHCGKQLMAVVIKSQVLLIKHVLF